MKERSKLQILESIERFIENGGIVSPVHGGFRGSDNTSEWNIACAVGAAVDEDPENKQLHGYFETAVDKFEITRVEAAEISDGFEHRNRKSEAERFGGEIYKRYVTGKRMNDSWPRKAT